MPTTPIRLGQDGPIVQASGVQFSPINWTWQVTEEGTWAQMVTRAAVYQAAGFQGSVTPINGSSPMARLTAQRVGSDPDDPDVDLITTWTLDVQWDNVPAMQSKKFSDWLNTESSGSATTAAGIVYKMGVPFEDLSTGEMAGWNATRQNWYMTIQQGRPIKEPHPVLRRVRTHSRAASAAADWTDVGKVWTTAQIEAAETVDESIGTLPAGKYWLKTSGTIEDGSDGRLTVVTHWIEGDYKSHEYDFKT